MVLGSSRIDLWAEGGGKMAARCLDATRRLQSRSTKGVHLGWGTVRDALRCRGLHGDISPHAAQWDECSSGRQSVRVLDGGESHQQPAARTSGGREAGRERRSRLRKLVED